MHRLARLVLSTLSLLLLFTATVALASDLSSDSGLLNVVVGLVQSNPKTAAALSLLSLLQHSAPWIAMIPALWGGNTGTSGAGSGWSKFWRKVENFPALPKLPPPV